MIIITMISELECDFSKFEFCKFLKYIDSLIYKFLFYFKSKNNSLDAIFYIFGSKALNIVSRNIVNHKFNDLDILCNKKYYHRIIDFLIKHNKKNIILNLNDIENNDSSMASLLKYNGILKVNKIKIKSLYIFFNYISEILPLQITKKNNFWKNLNKFDKLIKEKYDTVYSYEIDFVISSDNIDVKNVITSYANNLFSSKTFLLEIKNINDNKFNFHNINSYIFFSSIYSPIYLDYTLSTLIVLYNTYIKLFTKEGLSNNLNLINIKKIKNYKKKSKKYFVDLILEKNNHWMTYNTNMIYHFLILDELLTFPMTNDVKYFLNKINLNSNNIYEKWYKLLERIFDLSVNINIKTNIGKLKDLLVKCKIKQNNNNNLTCSLCLDKIGKRSAIHLCENGHVNHLSCIMEYEKKYCISILNSLNFRKIISNSVKHAKKCGICRKNNLNILDNNQEFNCDNTIVLNPNMSGIFRSKGLSINNLKNTNTIPKDIQFNQKISHNIERNSNGLQKYLIHKMNFIKNI